MRNKERLIELLTAYINEHMSEAEFDELIERMQQAHISDGEAQLASLFEKAWERVNRQHPIHLDANRVFNKIINDPKVAPSPLKRTPKMILATAGIAALIALVFFAAIYYRAQSPHHTQGFVTTENKDVKAIDKRGVFLTLSDGQQIPVDALDEGIQTLQSGGRIKKSNNQLTYTEDSIATTRGSNRLHTVTTPIGMDYTLTLTDGTRVQLNANSSITYPIAFHAAERKVELRGEAYFEVAKNPDQPFLIDAKGIQIKVLGTTFNVKAYQEEQNVVTTLLTGRVKVQSKLLSPGQQAASNVKNHSIDIREIDVEEAIAWRKGAFFFGNEDIETVMKTIARWYDIEVTYKGDLKGKTFGGTLSRYADFRQLLYAIEQTGSVKFTVEGRRVTVSP